MTKPKDPKDYKRIGRPPIPYDDIIGDEICLAIGSSTIGLERLCAANPHWPGHEVIYKWVIQIPSFGAKYAHAREMQQEARVNHMHAISEADDRDMYPDDKGVMRPNMARIARDKLITDNIKWEAARLSRKYKEKKELEQHHHTHETVIKDLD